MANYSFIINVGNAIDKSHFRMYFHESISSKRLTFYDIEDLSELEDKVNAIGRHIDRNVFDADSNVLYVCTSRTWMPQTDLLWWTLFRKSYVYSKVSGEVRKKLKKIYLIIVDGDEKTFEQDSSRRNRIEKSLMQNGFLESGVDLRSWDTEAHPVITEDQLSEIGRIYLGSGLQGELHTVFSDDKVGKVYDDFAIEMLGRYSELSENKELDGTEIFSYVDTFRQFFKEKLSKKLDTIDTLVTSVDPGDQAARRLSQLKLVTFLVDAVSGNAPSDISRAYSDYEKKFDPKAEALKLRSFAERIEYQLRRLERKTDDPKIEFRYRRVREISPLEDNKLIGNEEDIDKTLRKVMGFRNRENWDKEFEELLGEIAAYEDKLNDYGAQVNEEFHRNKAESVEESQPPYENEAEALSAIQKETEQANENAYRERDKGDNTYATILEITNQFNIVGSCLKKLNAARLAAGKGNFARILLFIVLMIVIPYSIMQIYIYPGMIKGNFMPLICVGALLLVVILARPAAVIALDRSFSKEVKKLQDQVRRYFDGIQQRQKLFHEGVNSMIAIWNAAQRHEACVQAIDIKREEHQRLDYHKNALRNYQSIMNYFDSFIYSYYDDESGYVLQQEKADLKTEKNIVDNRIYWIDKVIKES